MPASNTSSVLSLESNRRCMVWVSRASERFFKSHWLPETALMTRARLLSLLEELSLILVSIGLVGFLTKTFSDIVEKIQNVKLGFAKEMQDIFRFAFLNT